MNYLCEAYEVSKRHACEVAMMPRSTYHYKSRLGRQELLRMRLKDLAYSRVSYGYRRLLILLRREGWMVNHKRIYRLYVEEGLTLKRRKPKRHKAYAARHIRVEPTGLNDIWSMDFMSDQLADGSRFRVFTVIDIYTRECLALVASRKFRGSDVVKVLSALKNDRELPDHIFCDNGTEFTSKIMDQWAWFNGVQLDFSRPGKPVDNAYIESFNGRVRQECLNLHWFTEMDEVISTLEIWKMEYNMIRPHSSLGYLSPVEYARSYREKRKPVNALKSLEIT